MLDDLRTRVDEAVHHHTVVVANPYTRWFAQGGAGADEVRHLTVQFSVFSHQFVEAQLRKVINAPTLDAYRAGKEILMNELGVIFNHPQARAGAAKEAVFDPDRSSTSGSVDGSLFHFRAAHFEWLVEFARPL